MEVIDRIKDFFNKDDIGEPPWEYHFLQNLPESEYPKYLTKLYYYKTGEKLDLKNPKTFNEKIQWLKLYDATPLKRDLTDKVKVRDYVREKIGEKYLKPVLQICNSFDEIDFDKLPNSFIMKCNHGCKWHYIVKNKEQYLSVKKLVDITRKQMTGWLEQEYWPWGGFEMQYKGIEPKIIIEHFLIDENNFLEELEITCFNSEPKIFAKMSNKNREVLMFDQNYKPIDFKFGSKFSIIEGKADDILKQAVKHSKVLCQSFKLIRVDWIICNKQLYFNEMTFSPLSGFGIFEQIWNKKLGEYLNLILN